MVPPIPTVRALAEVRASSERPVAEAVMPENHSSEEIASRSSNQMSQAHAHRFYHDSRGMLRAGISEHKPLEQLRSQSEPGSALTHDRRATVAG